MRQDEKIAVVGAWLHTRGVHESKHPIDAVLVILAEDYIARKEEEMQLKTAQTSPLITKAEQINEEIRGDVNPPPRYEPVFTIKQLYAARNKFAQSHKDVLNQYNLNTIDAFIHYIDTE